MRMRRFVGGAAVAAGLCVSPVSAQSTPAERNIAVWPLPETLSAEGRALASQMAAMRQPDVLPPLETQRQIIDGMQQAMGAELLKWYDVRVTECTIAGVPVRIVYPNGTAELGKDAVLLNLHGGGFQLDSGSLTETIRIAALSGVPVVSVLYRLAPEHPYPAALDDALAVYLALEKDRPADRIAVYGASAGAILSGELIAALGFFSGTADLAAAGDSESWTPLPAKARSVGEGLHDYAGSTSLSDPVLSPLHGDVSGFPATLLVTSTRDFLLNATGIFGRTLLERGVDARLVVFDGLPHAFWAYMDIPESR